MPGPANVVICDFKHSRRLSVQEVPDLPQLILLAACSKITVYKGSNQPKKRNMFVIGCTVLPIPDLINLRILVRHGTVSATSEPVA